MDDANYFYNYWNGDSDNFPISYLGKSDWETYLTVAARYYDVKLWALSYAERYAQEQTWENLQRARMVLESACRNSQYCRTEEPSFSAEDTDLLVREGCDTVYTRMEILQFNDIAALNESDYASLRIRLHGDAFSKSGLENLRGVLANKRALAELNFRLLALSTAYLFSQFGEGEDVLGFRARIAESLPSIQACLPEPGLSAEALTAMTSEAYDDLALLNDEGNVLSGEAEVCRRNFHDAVMNGDVDRLHADRIAIDGVTEAVPMPLWLSLATEAECKYYPRNEAGELYPLKAFEEVEALPDHVNISVKGVDRDSVLSYLESLSKEKINATPTRNDAEGLEVYCSTEDGRFFVVSWSDETAAVDLPKDPVCMLPLWYFF